ncbi:hypothetical protein AAFX91_20075 [Bradyrhizobium sp. 31Argb]|uniref:hypothetical protein n=1 Tax=Bradyrhizobium sp. 31Argb TaxID=3141247 RepID=UPI00374A8406
MKVQWQVSKKWQGSFVGIFDFITLEQIESLPDDDPQNAFTEFVRIAQASLVILTRNTDTSQQEGWTELEESRHSFMNIVIGAAKKYEIQPFASLSVPRLQQFDEKVHRQFQADLDHYLTQLLLDNSSRSKRDSVTISPQLKTSIRTYLFHLRELIERSDDLSDSRRDALLKKLAEFEAELEKKRLNLMAVTVLAITLLAAPGGIWASADAAGKLLNNIMREIGEAKASDDSTRRLHSAEAPMALTGPRPNDPDLVGASTRSGRRDTSLDDDIPF